MASRSAWSRWSIYAVNKPEGYVSTNYDPSGRPRVVDLVPEIPERVYTVGRLDEDSTGLMILTNDGELANRLAHPRFGVEKLYRALVAGLPDPETLAKLTEGVWLSDGKVRAKRARIAGRQGQATILELVLAEGKKREIRRMLAKLGHKVMSLTRVAVGPITLKGLPVGECRPLTRHEVELLRKVASGVSLSVPGFAADEPSRSHRGPARGRQGDQPAAGRRQGDRRPDTRTRSRACDTALDMGTGRVPGLEAVAPPVRPGPGSILLASVRLMSTRNRPLRARPVRGPAVVRSVARRTAAGCAGAHRQSPTALGAQRPAGPRPPAGPGPQAKRPPARPVQKAPAPKPADEPTPRRRIIGLAGPAAAAVGGAPAGRKRPMTRKPRPPRSALGPRPGRLRPPHPKDDQDDEQ